MKRLCTLVAGLVLGCAGCIEHQNTRLYFDRQVPASAQVDYSLSSPTRQGWVDTSLSGSRVAGNFPYHDNPLKYVIVVNDSRGGYWRLISNDNGKSLHAVEHTVPGDVTRLYNAESKSGRIALERNRSAYEFLRDNH